MIHIMIFCLENRPRKFIYHENGFWHPLIVVLYPWKLIVFGSFIEKIWMFVHLCGLDFLTQRQIYFQLTDRKNLVNGKLFFQFSNIIKALISHETRNRVRARAKNRKIGLAPRKFHILNQMKYDPNGGSFSDHKPCTVILLSAASAVRKAYDAFLRQNHRQ